MVHFWGTLVSVTPRMPIPETPHPCSSSAHPFGQTVILLCYFCITAKKMTCPQITPLFPHSCIAETLAPAQVWDTAVAIATTFPQDFACAAASLATMVANQPGRHMTTSAFCVTWRVSGSYNRMVTRQWTASFFSTFSTERHTHTPL